MVDGYGSAVGQVAAVDGGDDVNEQWHRIERVGHLGTHGFVLPLRRLVKNVVDDVLRRAVAKPGLIQHQTIIIFRAGARKITRGEAVRVLLGWDANASSPKPPFWLRFAVALRLPQHLSILWHVKGCLSLQHYGAVALISGIDEVIFEEALQLTNITLPITLKTDDDISQLHLR